MEMHWPIYLYHKLSSQSKDKAFIPGLRKYVTTYPLPLVTDSHMASMYGGGQKGITQIIFYATPFLNILLITLILFLAYIGF